MKFDKCILRDSRGEESDELMLGEPFEIDIELVANSKAENLSIIVGFNTSLGVRVATALSSDQQKLYSTASKGDSAYIRLV